MPHGPGGGKAGNGPPGVPHKEPCTRRGAARPQDHSRRPDSRQSTRGRGNPLLQQRPGPVPAHWGGGVRLGGAPGPPEQRRRIGEAGLRRQYDALSRGAGIPRRRGGPAPTVGPHPAGDRPDRRGRGADHRPLPARRRGPGRPVRGHRAHPRRHVRYAQLSYNRGLHGHLLHGYRRGQRRQPGQTGPVGAGVPGNGEPGGGPGRRPGLHLRKGRPAAAHVDGGSGRTDGGRDHRHRRGPNAGKHRAT